MSKDALTISLTQVRRMLEMLGIEANTRTLRSVVIEGGRVTVVRRRVDENGRDVFIPQANEIATETITIAVTVHPEEMQAAVDARNAAEQAAAGAVS